MYIFFLLFLFIKNENKKYSKNMTNIYYIEDIPNTYTNNNTENVIINNENINSTYTKKKYNFCCRDLQCGNNSFWKISNVYSRFLD